MVLEDPSDVADDTRELLQKGYWKLVSTERPPGGRVLPFMTYKQLRVLLWQQAAQTQNEIELYQLLFLLVVFDLKQVKCFNLLNMITSKRHKFRIHCHSTPLLKNGVCTCTRWNELLYPLSLKFILLDSFYLGVADWRKRNQKSIKHNQSDCSLIGSVLEHNPTGTFRWVQ